GGLLGGEEAVARPCAFGVGLGGERTRKAEPLAVGGGERAALDQVARNPFPQPREPRRPRRRFGHADHQWYAEGRAYEQLQPAADLDEADRLGPGVRRAAAPEPLRQERGVVRPI